MPCRADRRDATGCNHEDATDSTSKSTGTARTDDPPAKVTGGKGGGGRADMAQAGGPDGSKADAALKAIEGALAVS